MSGRRIAETVELVDVMPTLADIAGLPKSIVNRSALDGISLIPLLLNTSVQDVPVEWVAKPAFSQYPRRASNPSELWAHNGIDHVPRFVLQVQLVQCLESNRAHLGVEDDG